MKKIIIGLLLMIVPVIWFFVLVALYGDQPIIPLPVAYSFLIGSGLLFAIGANLFFRTLAGDY